MKVLYSYSYNINIKSIFTHGCECYAIWFCNTKLHNPSQSNVKAQNQIPILESNYSSVSFTFSLSPQKSPNQKLPPHTKKNPNPKPPNSKSPTKINQIKNQPNNGVHTQSHNRRSLSHADLQSLLPPGELPDEVLSLPHPLMAAASLRGRRLQRQDRGLRASQNGRGKHRVPRPHHVARCVADSPQARAGDQAHERSSERHGASVWS